MLRDSSSSGMGPASGTVEWRARAREGGRKMKSAMRRLLKLALLICVVPLQVGFVALCIHLSTPGAALWPK